jgi:hypothetical protein
MVTTSTGDSKVLSEESTDFAAYVTEVRSEQLKAHNGSVRELAAYRLLRSLGLLAALATPIMAASNIPKVWTAIIAAAAALAFGVTQLTAIPELSVLDRDRSDAMHRELRRFDTGSEPYAADDRAHQFIRRVEAVRKQWEQQRRELVRQTFTVKLRQAADASD